MPGATGAAVPLEASARARKAARAGCGRAGLTAHHWGQRPVQARQRASLAQGPGRPCACRRRSHRPWPPRRPCRSTCRRIRCSLHRRRRRCRCRFRWLPGACSACASDRPPPLCRQHLWGERPRCQAPAPRATGTPRHPSRPAHPPCRASCCRSWRLRRCQRGRYEPCGGTGPAGWGCGGRGRAGPSAEGRPLSPLLLAGPSRVSHHASCAVSKVGVGGPREGSMAVPASRRVQLSQPHIPVRAAAPGASPCSWFAACRRRPFRLAGPGPPSPPPAPHQAVPEAPACVVRVGCGEGVARRLWRMGPCQCIRTSRKESNYG